METKQKLYEKIWKDLYKHSSRSSYESAWKIMKATRLHYMTLLSPWNFITLHHESWGSAPIWSPGTFRYWSCCWWPVQLPKFFVEALGSHQLIHPPNPLRPQLPFEFSPRCPATRLLMRRSEHPATAHGLTGWWVTAWGANTHPTEDDLWQDKMVR